MIGTDWKLGGFVFQEREKFVGASPISFSRCGDRLRTDEPLELVAVALPQPSALTHLPGPLGRHKIRVLLSAYECR
jgi:hypothetical protein